MDMIEAHKFFLLVYIYLTLGGCLFLKLFGAVFLPSVCPHSASRALTWYAQLSRPVPSTHCLLSRRLQG